jgi:hypothetical protein
MRIRALIALSAVACSLALGACGSGGAPHRLSLGQLPLVPGAKVATQTRLCDGGSHAFCAIQAVVVDPHAGSSGALVVSEQNRLHSLGWTTSAGDDGDEVAADSPGHKLRVTYATAINDLIGLDEKWIKRPWPIWSALSESMFNRVPAMSILLEVGPT